jgi:phage shock protein PspC (stress-responsive transcriptional regulator)
MIDDPKDFKLMPSPEAWIGGVCAGLAYSLSLPTWVVRLAVLALMFGYGIGLLPYLLLWLLVPNHEDTPADYVARTGDG